MDEKLDIFILTYKDFQQQVKNTVYKVVCCEDKTIDTTLPILYDTEKCNSRNNILDSITDWNSFYSELTMTYWLWKNYKIKDYVGICHYRRYFEFMDEIPDLYSIFSEYDVILPKPFLFNVDLNGQYSIYHNVFDLNTMLEVISELYPEYNDDAENVLKGNKFYPCNMFIMKKENFISYCEFIFSVVDGYLKKLNLKTVEDVKTMVCDKWEDYYKPFFPNNTLSYQMRIGGFLSERLLNIFIKHNFNKIKEIPFYITEKKY